MRIASERRRQGWRPRAIDTRVYAPFPVGGLAAWTDTWGAPRHSGGYHPHHGQDLLCAEGTPLLAVGAGTVRLGGDRLGGTSVYLTRPDGSSWYYAHLLGYASGLVSGAQVRTGERIGRCGATGDATVSHVHFALFSASGVAQDPMRSLVRWLHAAERSGGLHPSTGDGVHLPKRFGSEVGAEASDVAMRVAASDAATISRAHAPVAQFEPGVSSGGASMLAPILVVAALLLPLASRRVRARGRRVRRA